MRGIRSRFAIKKIVAGLALFYCGCNQSKSLHICGCKDTTKKRKTENGKRKTFKKITIFAESVVEIHITNSKSSDKIQVYIHRSRRTLGSRTHFVRRQSSRCSMRGVGYR